MAKAWPVSDSSGKHLGWMIECPACGCAHKFDAGHWTFNGNMDRPTFSPSMLVHCPPSVCHSFVRDGRIEFLADCTHALAGKTVDLPDA